MSGEGDGPEEKPPPRGALPLEYRRYLRPARTSASSDSGGMSGYVSGFVVGLVGFLGATGYLYLWALFSTLDGEGEGFLPMILVDGGFVGLWIFLWVLDRRVELWKGVSFLRGMLSGIAIVSVLQGLLLLFVRYVF